VEDTARVFVRSEAGVMGSVDLSWSINKELDWFVTVYGSQGTLQVGWKQSRYKTTGKDWVVFGNGYDKVRAFQNQVANFAGAIRKKEPLRITWKDAVASVEVIESAYRSMRAAPWTDIIYPVDLTMTPWPGAVLREVA
jgi:predicted dehydrogenase